MQTQENIEIRIEALREQVVNFLHKKENAAKKLDARHNLSPDEEFLHLVDEQLLCQMRAQEVAAQVEILIWVLNDSDTLLAKIREEGKA